MLSGGAVPEPVGTGECVPPLVEETPEAEEREAGLASRERPARPFSVAEAPSTPVVKSLSGLRSAWLASSRSSFSECWAVLVRSVLAIDASGDAGRERYVYKRSQKLQSRQAEEGPAAEYTEAQVGDRPALEDWSSQKPVTQSRRLVRRAFPSPANRRPRGNSRRPLKCAMSEISNTACTTLATVLSLSLPLLQAPRPPRHVSSSVLLLPLFLAAQERNAEVMDPADLPASRPSTSGQHMPPHVNGVKRSFTHLDEGRYEDPRSVAHRRCTCPVLIAPAAS